MSTRFYPTRKADQAPVKQTFRIMRTVFHASEQLCLQGRFPMTEVASSGTAGDWLPRGLRLVRAGGTRKYLQPLTLCGLRQAILTACLVLSSTVRLLSQRQDEELLHGWGTSKSVVFNVPRRCHDLRIIEIEKLPNRKHPQRRRLFLSSGTLL